MRALRTGQRRASFPVPSVSELADQSRSVHKIQQLRRDHCRQWSARPSGNNLPIVNLAQRALMAINHLISNARNSWSILWSDTHYSPVSSTVYITLYKQKRILVDGMFLLSKRFPSFYHGQKSRTFEPALWYAAFFLNKDPDYKRDLALAKPPVIPSKTLRCEHRRVRAARYNKTLTE